MFASPMMLTSEAVRTQVSAMVVSMSFARWEVERQFLVGGYCRGVGTAEFVLVVETGRLCGWLRWVGGGIVIRWGGVG